jgi:hypothetical protein
MSEYMRTRKFPAGNISCSKKGMCEVFAGKYTGEKKST